jgi:23S rRNA-/tRNA-specific pseudouridylate synthase
MAVTASGREAVTEYRVTRRYRHPVSVTLLEARLETGRTHQVRVHLAAIGHGVVGDDRYGRQSHSRTAPDLGLEPGRLFLHAQSLDLEHPDGGRMRWESPLPSDLLSALDLLIPV